jgi:hypothetical protein
MNTLQNLSNEKLSLTALLLDLDESITKAQKEVEASFRTSANTDGLSQNLSMLHSKRVSLENAIKSNDEAIKQAHLDVLAEETSKQIAIRKNAIVDALKANEEAQVLAEKLAKQFRTFNKNVFLAGANSSELTAQPRILMGKLALEFHLLGGLTGAAVLPLLTVEDASKIQSKIG